MISNSSGLCKIYIYIFFFNCSSHTLSIRPLDSPVWSIRPSSSVFLWSDITSSIIWEVLILLFSSHHITVRIWWRVHLLSFSCCIRKLCKCAWELIQKTGNHKQMDRLDIKKLTSHFPLDSPLCFSQFGKLFVFALLILLCIFYMLH